MRGIMGQEMNKTVARGVLVFYVNVGQLPPNRAEAFLERMKASFLAAPQENLAWKLPDDVGTFWIPVRNQDTYVDFISFEGFNEDANQHIEEVMEKISNVFNSVFAQELNKVFSPLIKKE
jgi:hypothetical protein